MAVEIIRPQKKLETFCRAIDLSKYELRREVDRIKTFIDNDWENQFVKADILAQLGFYFHEKPDHVICVFCAVHLKNFELDDDVLKEHLKFSPNCPLLRRRETNNEPLNGEELDKILPPASYDECGSGPSRRKHSRVEEDLAYPDFRFPSKRMKSFDTWPIGIKQKSEDLVAAGFFYSGQSDLTVCFSCGLSVGKWEADDNPWVEHKKLLEKECNYLKINEEKLKINQQSYEELQSSKEPAEQNSDAKDENEKEIDFETCCKICMASKSSILFIPCHHVAVCGQCFFGIGDNCPICRSPIDKTIPLKFA